MQRLQPAWFSEGKLRPSQGVTTQCALIPELLEINPLPLCCLEILPLGEENQILTLLHIYFPDSEVLCEK